MTVARALSVLRGSRSFWTRTYPLACKYLCTLDQSYTDRFVEVVSSGLLRKCQYSGCSVIYSCKVLMPICTQFWSPCHLCQMVWAFVDLPYYSHLSRTEGGRNSDVCSISMLLTPLFLTIFTSAFRIFTHLQFKVMLMNEYDTNGYSQSPISDARPDATPWLRLSADLGVEIRVDIILERVAKVYSTPQRCAPNH